MTNIRKRSCCRPVCKVCFKKGQINPECTECNGTGEEQD